MSGRVAANPSSLAIARVPAHRPAIPTTDHVYAPLRARERAVTFAGSGPLVILTSHPLLTDPGLIGKLRAKGIEKFIAYELPFAVVDLELIRSSLTRLRRTGCVRAPARQGDHPGGRVGGDQRCLARRRGACTTLSDSQTLRTANCSIFPARGVPQYIRAETARAAHPPAPANPTQNVRLSKYLYK